MSKQSGESGMGIHKHRISGRVPHNKTNAMRRSREFNEEADQKQKFKESHKSKMFSSVSELFV